jgi:Domain of unknown function (DUF5658)
VPSAAITATRVLEIDTDEHQTSRLRGGEDRRRRPTMPLDAFRSGGRRTRPRRAQERQGAFFVDRFDTITLAMVVGLLGLTIVDGVLTILLLDFNSEEINPLLGHLLTRGQPAFLLAKYLLTAAGLPFLVVYKSYPLFGTRFRVGWLLPVFIGMYVVLLCYQTALLFAAGPGPGAVKSWQGTNASEQTEIYDDGLASRRARTGILPAGFLRRELRQCVRSSHSQGVEPAAATVALPAMRHDDPRRRQHPALRLADLAR